MTIYPLSFHLGPLNITGYGIMMMVAFLMAGWAIQLDLRSQGMKEEYAADIIFAAVIGGIVGAKIWYVLLTHDWDALFRRGGFVWYGGFLGGVAGVLAMGWWRRVPARWTMQLTAAPLALGYALGRVGCFLVNDDYGIPSNLPWAMKFPEGLPPTTIANLQQMHVAFPPDANPLQVVAVHPTQLYETALMLLAFALLWRLRGQRHAVGWLFGLYLVLAGTERFLVEIVRAKDDRLFGPFSLAQATSTLLVVAGVWLLVRLRQPEPVSLAAPALTETTAAAGPVRLR